MFWRFTRWEDVWHGHDLTIGMFVSLFPALDRLDSA